MEGKTHEVHSEEFGPEPKSDSELGKMEREESPKAAGALTLADDASKNNDGGGRLDGIGARPKCERTD